MRNRLKILFLLLTASTAISAQNSASDPPRSPLVGITVLGEVRSPGFFEIKRKIGLLEALSFAGGLKENAGEEISVIRKDPHSAKTLEFLFKLKELMTGKANPYLENGDIVIVPFKLRVLDEKTKLEIKNKKNKFLQKEPYLVVPFKFAPNEV